MKMKARNKILLLALCMAALIAVSVIGTMAYLTSTDKVTNTFTVGKVEITLDEAKVTADGKAVEGAARANENEYHLMPGHLYTKDPTVHVTADSENSWIFIQVRNDISAYEAETVEGGYTAIADQITKNGWTALAGKAGVYYKEYTKTDKATDLVVFSEFKISDTANDTAGWASINKDTTKIVVNAYAIQKDGFEDVTKAWTEVSKTTAVTPVV